jgi:hypothetical protein
MSRPNITYNPRQGAWEVIAAAAGVPPAILAFIR